MRSVRWWSALHEARNVGRQRAHVMNPTNGEGPRRWTRLSPQDSHTTNITILAEISPRGKTSMQRSATSLVA
jgi:hypothetical protein